MHCYTEYDEQLQAALPHLVNYPKLLPFIGAAWPNLPVKIMLIAESHYLPEKGVSDSNSWYTGNQTLVTNPGWINTRGVIHTADNFSVTKQGYSRGHAIFHRIKKAVFDAQNVQNRKQTIFQNFGFYNYFQRPAEKTGESINNTELDDAVAYDTFKAICKITEPTAVIFVSQKAYRSFQNKSSTEREELFGHIKIQNITHPSSLWWYRKSGKLLANGKAETGKQKFMRTLDCYKFQLANFEN